ncbi:hypothetical protein GCM10027515_20410 [Schumannella luteola]|jgi:hypothetical protein|uniref:Ribosomal protein S13 n=1 Tax=Schumannella luteola TaxID=472059 RepID=A0A852YEH8_9MICO|nr:hypothetical protein [Schumannella luteola]NYH00163.1 ribosomal protein S13 [Schumannella luteola]TPX04079.1 hypothetical protein FJ656_13875 [Schumannella luteola]
MSCIRFNTPAQRAQLARMAPSMKTAEEIANEHPAPPVTESKIRRLRVLAESPVGKIRESVASSYHTPADVIEKLKQDPDASVRAVLARNETTPCDVLRDLADDESATVRGWVAVNYFVPDDVMQKLADDEDDTVRRLVAWKASLAEEAAQLEGQPA